MGKASNIVIALYVNVEKDHLKFISGEGAKLEHDKQRREQVASYLILREWVRQNVVEQEHMHRFLEGMHEIEGRGYLFKINGVHWGEERNPLYLLIQRTLKEMADAFDCTLHSGDSTPYALEYAHVRSDGMEYDTVRLGAYAYAVGVVVETEVAGDFLASIPTGIDHV